MRVLQILPWPNCELDEKENSQKMTDILDLPAVSQRVVSVYTSVQRSSRSPLSCNLAVMGDGSPRSHTGCFCFLNSHPRHQTKHFCGVHN